ncbi:hypothetical protein [Streptomyces sp. NPDC056452]|uniref:hypothetical protein n=1 Tax=Streptomyces sp. NPDC056452 TaxID=3345821 RepID=UPI0036B3152F
MAVSVCIALLGGCGERRETATRDRPDELSALGGLSQLLSFRYVADSGEDDTMNQVLEINNVSWSSLAPVLTFEALDKNRRVLHDVEVKTVYGSDRGALVVPQGQFYDVLRFSGIGQEDVVDVRVTVGSVAMTRLPASQGEFEVPTQAVDSRGRDMSRFERFAGVKLTNDNDFPVTVRVVYIVWDQPEEGDTQQAVEVTPVGGLTVVPAGSTETVKVTGAAKAAVARSSDGPAVSIKTFYSQ